MASISTNNSSDENISQEENQRKIREKLELELAAKEREIATLVIDTQKLQSTLIKVKETSVTQVMNHHAVKISYFVYDSDIRSRKCFNCQRKIHCTTRK
jgi:hypothetical protein